MPLPHDFRQSAFTTFRFWQNQAFTSQDSPSDPSSLQVQTSLILSKLVLYHGHQNGVNPPTVFQMQLATSRCGQMLLTELRTGSLGNAGSVGCRTIRSRS